MNLLGIVNPRAAGGRSLKRLPALRAALDSSQHAVDWVVASSIGEARRRIREAPSCGVDGVLLVGGDGTVHGALPALREAALPFGILPCGRGNDFARNLGMPLHAPAANWRNDDVQIRHVDLPTVDGRPFASVASLGFDALASRLAVEHAGFFGGTFGYVVCVLRALRSFEPFDVELTVDEWSWKGRITLVAVANGACYGGGMRIAPNATMDDGVLEVCVVKAVSRTTLLAQFPKVFRGTHGSHPAVITVSGSVVTVQTCRSEVLYADGEYVGRTPTVVAVEPRSLPVLIPVTGQSR